MATERSEGGSNSDTINMPITSVSHGSPDLAAT